MRILHLIDAHSPQATRATLAMLATAMGRLGAIDQHVLLLGGSALRDAAHDAGLVDPDHVHLLGVPFGRAMLGWHAVTRRIAGLPAIDLVHCWSAGTFAFASLALRHLPRVLTLTSEPSAGTVKWFRIVSGEAARSASAPATFLPISATIRRTLLTGGIDEEAVHVLRPGIDMSMVAHGERAALRKAWGVAPAHDRETTIVALLADRPEAVDTLHPALVAGIAEEVTPTRWRILAHPLGHRRLRAERMLRHTRGPDRLIREPRLAAPWQVLSGCDVALALGDGGGLSLLWAMAANLPIVGEATYAISEILEDRHSALLAKPNDVRELVKRLTRVVGDQQLAWKLRDTARHEAYSFFSRQRYCQSLQSVYQQVIERQPIAIPELEATGGLRFTGRA